MKYWFDTEFIEQPFAIELVSIGIVSEDGREFYAENSAADWSKANQWTLDHVRPHLTGGAAAAADPEEISYGIMRFVDGDDDPQFWGYYAAFDWVAMCGVFGSLGELPFAFPQLCLDLKQWAIALGDPPLPPQTSQKHNALTDARWTKQAWEFLASLSPPGKARGGESQPCAKPPHPKEPWPPAQG